MKKIASHTNTKIKSKHMNEKCICNDIFYHITTTEIVGIKAASKRQTSKTVLWSITRNQKFETDTS